MHRHLRRSWHRKTLKKIRSSAPWHRCIYYCAGSTTINDCDITIGVRTMCSHVLPPHPRAAVCGLAIQALVVVP